MFEIIWLYQNVRRISKSCLCPLDLKHKIHQIILNLFDFHFICLFDFHFICLLGKNKFHLLLNGSSLAGVPPQPHTSLKVPEPRLKSKTEKESSKKYLAQNWVQSSAGCEEMVRNHLCASRPKSGRNIVQEDETNENLYAMPTS